MGFFKSKSLKGNHPSSIGGEDQAAAAAAASSKHPYQPEQAYTPPSGPPPARSINYPSSQQYAPPPGPPPGHQEQFGPPVSPPPGHEQYAPPPGPPPSHQEQYSSPPGPPPGHIDPPPYHDWTVVPDNALLPPPPSAGHEQPATNNADSQEADRAHDWCRANPLVYPHQPTHAQLAAVNNGDVRLMKPREYKGDLLMPGTGHWKGSTRAGMKDSCLITSSPLYFAYTDSPVHSGKAKTVYYEVEILSMGYAGTNSESTIALGYCAMPYPTWRMPGWERASLGIHSDDGRRYVNDTWGGKDFTEPLRRGDTVGIGLKFSVPESPPDYNVDSRPALLKSSIQVFFTKNGNYCGDWNLHEELDHELDQGVDGLDGLFDLYGAVGIFGGTEFAVKFKRDEWLWRPH